MNASAPAPAGSGEKPVARSAPPSSVADMPPPARSSLVRDEATGAWSVASPSPAASVNGTSAPPAPGRDTEVPPASRPAPPTGTPAARGPERGPPATGTAGIRPWSAALAGVLGLLTAAASGLAHILVARDIPIPAGLREATVGANAYALSRLDSLPVPGSLSDQLLSVHVGLYDELATAAERNASVAGSVREFLLVVAVVSALAVFILCRQLGLSALAAAAAALLSGLAPALVSAQVLAFPASVALMWLLLAGAVIGARPSTAAFTWLGRLVSALLVALAVVIAPIIVVLPAGILAAALGSGALFPRWRIGPRLATCGLVLATAAAVVLLAPEALQALSDSPVRTGTAVAVAATGLLLAAVASRVRWLRPAALGCVPIFVIALLPVAGAPSAVIASIPVVAMLLATFLEESLRGRLRPGATLWRVVAGVLAVAVVVGLVVAPPSASQADPGSPQLGLAQWIGGNVGADTVLQVTPLLWVELVRAGVPEQQLQRTDDPAADVPVPVLLAERGQAHADFPLAARFGTGPLAISVRERVPDVAQADAACTAEQQASAELGTVLRNNPSVVLQGTAGPDLSSGRVDGRLLTVLAAAAADFRFTVAGFPRVNGDPAVGTLRTVRLSGVQQRGDGGEGSPGVQLRDYFRYQLPSYRPLGQGFDGGVLVVTYAAPSPVGLLA